jgi:dihydrodipicolinate synthase/N-acetylneuraminate lyase
MPPTELDHRPLIVAAVTPLSEGGHAIDDGAIAPYAAFLEAHGADGVFACGTTGEGVLLSLDERRRTAAAFRDAVGGTLIVHAGAQTTADTVALAAHASEIGADAVAVIAPPYFTLDADALTAHFVAAARACAPLPFYCYAFTARSGYPLPVDVIRRIGASVDNLAGLKVSESPFERVEPYLDLGLPVLIGSEPLIAARSGPCRGWRRASRTWCEPRWTTRPTRPRGAWPPCDRPWRRAASSSRPQSTCSASAAPRSAPQCARRCAR